MKQLNRHNIATKVSVFSKYFGRSQYHYQYDFVKRLVQPISITLPDLVYK